MPRWKTTIDISDLHRVYEAGALLPSALGTAVAERVRANRYAPELAETIEAFEAAEDVDDYDEALRELYDFADRGNRIWIETVG